MIYEPTELTEAFVNRTDEKRFIEIGHKVSTKPLNDVEAAWEGYEYLKYEVE